MHTCGLHKAAKPSRREKQFYDELHRIADKAMPKVRKQFKEAINDLQASTRIGELQAAVETGSERVILELLGLEVLERDLQPMINELRGVFQDAADASVSQLPKAIRAEASFNLLNPESVNYLQTTQFNLIQGITANTERGVRQIVTDAFEQGGHPRTQAIRIRNLIGLTPRQATAVDNFRAMLEAEDVAPRVIERRVAAFYQRQLRFRATNIARTETIRASNFGQQALWEQAADEGLIDRNTMRRVWVVTPDDRLCPICEPIPDLNADGVRLKEPFNTPAGPMIAPPAHPQCRCALAIGAF